jgi:hypothetical protein
MMHTKDAGKSTVMLNCTLQNGNAQNLQAGSATAPAK